jgi:hypothetical protein
MAESFSVVSEDEVVVVFVTVDGESTERNISERHKIESWSLEKEMV